MAAVISAALHWMTDPSQFEALARDAVRTDETVRAELGEVLEVRRKMLGGRAIRSVGNEWGARYEFHLVGRDGAGDASIDLEGTGSRWRSYAGTLRTDDGRTVHFTEPRPAD